MALSIDSFVDEYETLIAELGADASDDRIIAALVADHDWTAEGAQAVIMLARTYGTFVLRNALALAAAMGIEDGESGL